MYNIAIATNLQDQKVIQEMQVALQVLKEIQEFQVLKETQVLKEIQEFQVLKEIQEFQVLKEI